ncbi:MAG: ABC transporter [Gammaproteobacteria bacterium]|nr:MAG: ABC transporter [Gammaproteobacteria bacterium]
MDVTPKSRLYWRAQHALFVALLLAAVGLIAWLSTRYHYQADWTANARHTLSETSQTLLREMNGPLKITVYAREKETIGRAAAALLARYQRHKPDLAVRFVNPVEQPDEVRAQGIRLEGEVLIEYGGRNARASELSEQALSDALMRVARRGERRLVFLGGHGERNPRGEANHDLKLWVNEMESKGFNVETLNLGVNPQIPANTTLLAIAGPSAALLPGEVKLIRDYLSQGGNLLWLADPGPLHGLEPLAEELGVEFQSGVIVDATTQLLGIERPEFALVAEYGAHPITRGLDQLTLFPRAAGLEAKAAPGWEAQAFLQSSARSWAETGELSGEVKYDADKDSMGPLNLALALTREPPGAGQQRVAVLGDGDFLSNTYLGNGANLALGLNIVNWLAGDDSLIAIPVKTSPDTRLNLSRNATLFIGLGFLLALPLALLIAGLAIWLKRRGR